MDRPEFARANFGIEFYALGHRQNRLRAQRKKTLRPSFHDKAFVGRNASRKLGADYRFHTKIYRTGPLDKKGKLKGDLVLVASGDPNLSNRIRPDGTLAFVDEDHSYGGPAVSGDPLGGHQGTRESRRSKRSKGIDGHILVDTSLVADGSREGGTGVVMSSIMVNDNLIDIVGNSSAKPVRPCGSNPRPKPVTFDL